MTLKFQLLSGAALVTGIPIILYRLGYKYYFLLLRALELPIQKFMPNPQELISEGGHLLMVYNLSFVHIASLTTIIILIIGLITIPYRSGNGKNRFLRVLWVSLFMLTVLFTINHIEVKARICVKKSLKSMLEISNSRDNSGSNVYPMATVEFCDPQTLVLQKARILLYNNGSYAFLDLNAKKTVYIVDEDKICSIEILNAES